MLNANVLVAMYSLATEWQRHVISMGSNDRENATLLVVVYSTASEGYRVLSTGCCARTHFLYCIKAAVDLLISQSVSGRSLVE